MPIPARNVYIGVGCALIGSVGFSAKTIFVKLVYQYDVDVMTLLALRMIFALPFFIAMAWWAGGGTTQITRREWIAAAGLGFVGYYLGSYFDFAGLQYITAGLGRLILYLYPTLVLLLSALLLKQPIRGRHVISLALSYGGIALVFNHDARIGENQALTALGALLVLAGAMTQAIYLIAGGRLVQKLGSTRLTAYASISASFFVLTHFMLTHSPRMLVVPVPVYGLTFAMAIFSTVLPLWLVAEALKRIGASQAALVGCIGPISTIALAYAFLGEPIGAVQLAGAALVLAGVTIISLKSKPVI